MIRIYKSNLVHKCTSTKIIVALMLFIFVFFAYSQENMDNWEYKVISIMTSNEFPEVAILDNVKDIKETNMHIETMQNMLNRYGNNGWELINIFPGYMDSKELIFIRKQVMINIEKSGGLLVFTRWVDYNGDEIVTTNEMYGIGQKIFYYNEDIINIYFKPPENSNDGEVVFQSWSEKGRLLGETKRNVMNGSSVTYNTNYKNVANGDFMDKIGLSGVGGYKIIAMFNGIEYKSEIKIK